MENTEQAKEYTEKQVDDAYDKGIENGKQHDPKVNEYCKELSEPTLLDSKYHDYGNGGDNRSLFDKDVNKWKQSPTRSEFIKSLLEKQESDKERMKQLEFCLKTETSENITARLQLQVKLNKQIELNLNLTVSSREQLTQAKKDIDELREGVECQCGEAEVLHVCSSCIDDIVREGA